MKVESVKIDGFGGNQEAHTVDATEHETCDCPMHMSLSHLSGMECFALCGISHEYHMCVLTAFTSTSLVNLNERCRHRTTAPLESDPSSAPSLMLESLKAAHAEPTASQAARSSLSTTSHSRASTSHATHFSTAFTFIRTVPRTPITATRFLR